MTQTRKVLLALTGLLLITVSACAHAWGGPRVVLGVNVGVPLYYPGYYPAYYPPVYYAPPPPVYVQQPVVVSQPPSEVVYQYYCAATNAYYPAVPTCAQPWLKVLPDGTVH